MPRDFAFRLSGVGKSYAIFNKPIDRLKQMVMRGRRRYYREFWALQDVSFDIARGEAVGIIGRNGAGKSTLLKLLCGTLRPSTGRIEATGRVAAMLELGAGFNPEFTGVENVFLAAAVLGLSDAEIEQRYPAIAEFAGIGDFINQPVKHYSSGMYARLAFAVAAHVDADILIVDELFSVGDAAFQQKCQRFAEEFKRRGTFLLVSHDAATIAAFCDRAIWLEAGSVKAIGAADQVCADYLASIGPTSASAPPQVEAERVEIDDRATPSNVIQISAFDADAAWFGMHGAEIADVAIVDQTGNRLAEVNGGQIVHLRVAIRAMQAIERALIGFHIGNEAGQIVIGENTDRRYRDAPLRVEAGQVAEAMFELRLPLLPIGRFSLGVAIGDGTQTNRVDHQWIDAAVHLDVVSSPVRRGLVGLPGMRVQVTSRRLNAR